MRTLCIFAAALLFAGCAGKKTPAPPAPSIAPVKTAVQAAAEGARKTGQRQDAAQGRVSSASVKAATLMRVSSPDLQPLVAELQADLDAASAEIAAAKTSLAEIVVALTDAEMRADQAQKDIDLLNNRAFRERQLREAAEARELEWKAKHQIAVEKLNKWRVGAALIGGCGALLLLRRPIGAMFGIPIP